MPQQKQVFDITIIGGGPVGLFTAFYAGMRELSIKIIESLPQLGGQLAALYPEKYIYDIAGFPKVCAQELIENLKEQMKQFSPTICLEQSVENIERQSDGIFKLTTNEDIHFSRTIIITAGNGAFQPKTLPIATKEQYEGSCLHYFIDDLNKFVGKRVIVFGGGDSAVDWALMLELIAKQVTLVHRRTAFRAHEKSVDHLKNSTVKVLTPYIPVELIGEGRVNKVVLKEARGLGKITMDVDDIVVNYGFASSLGPIKNWGLSIENNSIVVNRKMETNIKGIFAAGDICTYDGKLKLIACGFGEAPIAVSSAKVFIDPKATMQTLHSTTLMK